MQSIADSLPPLESVSSVVDAPMQPAETITQPPPQTFNLSDDEMTRSPQDALTAEEREIEDVLRR